MPVATLSYAQGTLTQETVDKFISVMKEQDFAVVPLEYTPLYGITPPVPALLVLPSRI